MTVTKIEEYSKSKYRIYLNDAFAFVLYKGEVRHFKISEGEELEDTVYKEIVEQVLTKRAKLRAMHLLKTIDRTEADVRQKLKDGLYPEEVIDCAIAYIKGYHYIDDERYAENYISSRASGMSRNVLRQKLIQKGIDKEIADTKLAACLGDDGEREMSLIKSLMQKKCRNISELDYDSKNKLFSYLYRKGFSIENINRAYKELLLDIT